MTKNFDRQRKMNTESGMILKVSFLVIVFLMIILTPGVAQNKKPRKKLKEWLQMADSLRLQLRQSADKGRMLQWGDSLLMAELSKSKMSEKKKQRFLKHYAKIQKRLSLSMTAVSFGVILSWLPIITRSSMIPIISPVPMPDGR